MRIKRFTAILFVLALLTGGATVVGAKSYIEQTIATLQEELASRYETVKVAVAAADLPTGSTLGSSNLLAREIPREFLHADAILVSQWQDVAGQTLRADLTRGAPVLRSHLAEPRTAGLAAALDSGKRALTVAVDQISSISGMLRPGDRIDILLTLARNGQAQTFPLLKQIPVLATGVRTDEHDDADERVAARGFNTVTLLVDPEQAAKIVHAREVGSLTVALRAVEDASDGWPERVTLASLLGETPPPPPAPKRKPRPRRTVEVILGGHGATLH